MQLSGQDNIVFQLHRNLFSDERFEEWQKYLKKDKGKKPARL